MFYLLQGGISPLYVASSYNHEKVVKLLVASGGNPDLSSDVRNCISSQFHKG